MFWMLAASLVGTSACTVGTIRDCAEKIKCSRISASVKKTYTLDLTPVKKTSFTQSGIMEHVMFYDVYKIHLFCSCIYSLGGSQIFL